MPATASDLSGPVEAMARGEYALARRLLEARLAEHPDDADAHALLAEVLALEQGRPPPRRCGPLQADDRHRYATPEDALPPPPPPKRPVGVTIFAWLTLVGGAIGVVGAFALVAGGAGAWGLLAVAFAAAQVVGGIGLLGLRRWAWALAITTAGVAIVLNLVAFAASPGRAFLTILLAAVELGYLLAVQRAFRPGEVPLANL